MTVSTTATSSPVYVGNDVTTAFPTTFMFLDNDTVIPVLIVGVVETDLVTGFTVTGTGVESGGTVTLTAPLATGTSLRIDRRTPLTQPVSIRNLGYFAPDVHEEAWNRSTMQIQELNESKLDRDGVVLIVEEAGVQVDGLLRADLANPNAPYGSQLVAFLQSGTGAVARTSQDKMRDEVSAFDYMTDAQRADVRAGTLSLDVTAAIQAAVNAVQPRGKVRLPAGDYRVSSAIALGGTGIVLEGDGISATRLVMYSGTGDVLSVTDGSNRIIISSLTVDSAVTRTSGAGIASRGVAGNIRILDTQCTSQYDGYYLCGTDTSVLENALSSRNYHDGIVLENAQHTGGGTQWTLRHVASELNDRDGISVRSIIAGGITQMTLGNFDDVNIFGNTRYGISVIGSATVPIYGFRTNGLFSGQNGNDSLYINTYGNQHNIADFYLELDGSSPTGRNYSTPPSGIGNGITITANNTTLRVRDGLIKAMSLRGIVNAASELLMLADVSVEDCGQAATSIGIYHNTATGRLVGTGIQSRNTGAGSSQNYGLYADDLSLVALTGYDLTGNSVDSYGGGSPTQVNMVCGFPVNAGNHLMGPLTVGAVAISGSINVSGDIKKNGVAFTNP